MIAPHVEDPGAAPPVSRVRPPLWRRVRAKGVRGTLVALAARARPPRVSGYRELARSFAGARGLEIGGPSSVFGAGGLLPIYPIVSSLDNVNFAVDTIWQPLQDDGEYRFSANRTPGVQFTAEATDLRQIPDAGYDFVLSSHTIEHTANPLRALAEWRRAIRPGGRLVLVVPDKQRTFDHRRPVTPLGHLREDLERNTGEDDLTHVAESEALHDKHRDPDEIRAEVPLAEHNRFTRVMHHHVFDIDLVEQVVLAAGFELVALELAAPCHIFALAQRPSEERTKAPAHS